MKHFLAQMLQGLANQKLVSKSLRKGKFVDVDLRRWDL